MATAKKAKSTKTPAKKKPAKKATPTKTPAKKRPAKPATDESATAAPPPKARAEYDSLLREISVAEHDELRGWDRKWEAVSVVLAKKYYLFDDDANTAPLWMKKHLREEYRTGFRNARVAKLASPEEEQRFTVTKIDLAYTIEEARQQAEAKAKGVEWTAPDVPKKLDLDALRYAVERDGKRVKLSLDDISAAELRALQSSESKREGAPRARMSKSAKAVVRAVGERKSLGNVTVREHDNELTIDNVRADQLRELGQLLVELDVPVD